MSGVIGMNDWEKELAAGRNHVAKLLNDGMGDELQGAGCSHPTVCEFETPSGEVWCSACGGRLRGAGCGFRDAAEFEGSVSKPKQSEE